MTAPKRATRNLEHALGLRARALFSPGITDFVLFVLKQGWACLFGGLLLIAIIASKYVWQPDWPIYRYDALFVFALCTQAAFLWFKLETWEEARVIALFHLTGTAMELFKVNAGSWAYPEPGLIKLLDVPLFSGFMYAAVGSYMARVIRNFDMRFAPYPPIRWTFALGLAIYANFFAHHFLPDLRWGLIGATLILFARTRIWFRVSVKDHWMPLPVAAGLSSFALWVAENVGTATGTWLYSGQRPEHWVSFGKISSWYLLLYVAFITVTFVNRSPLSQYALTTDQR